MKKNILFFTFIITISIITNAQPYQWWQKSYSGPANSQDTSSLVVMDNAGNVYVSGWTNGFGTGSDIILIKYNAVSGDSAWVRRYNSPSNNDDKPLAMVADNYGYVYITGFSFQPTRDIITLKYDGYGVLLWSATYNGTNNGGDYGYGITVDGSGNVYVTGRSDDSSQHFTTLKYNSSGVPQWVSVYNGPLSQNFDQANDIKVDNNGNVYVTGFTSILQNFATADYLTLKYNGSGVLQWAKRYNGSGNGEDRAAALVIDNSNVFVTGFTTRVTNNVDFLTLKYMASNGDSLAAAFYGGPPTNGQTDEATCMAIDNSNNVYVSGFSYGNSNTYDYATVKYDNNLVQQWAARYEGSGIDVPSRVAVAGSNVYVTGYSQSSSGYDFLTVKYNYAGMQQWENRFHGGVNGNDYATGLTVDQNDNVFVAGYGPVSGNVTNIFTIRLSPNPIGIVPISNEIPSKFELFQNYPNPFNPATKIRYGLPAASSVKIVVYDVLGKEVQTLVNENQNPGIYEVSWEGDRFSSGVYFYKLTAGNSFTDIKKMVITK